MDKQETTSVFGYEPRYNGEKPVIEVSSPVKKIIDREMLCLYNLADFAIWNDGLSPDAILLGTEEFNEFDLKARPHLKCISRIGTGIDNIRLPQSTIDKLVVTERRYTPMAVVEYDTALFYRWLWGRDMSVNEITVGIIGTGEIGNRLDYAMRKRVGVGRVVTTDILRPEPTGLQVEANCDILFVHIPSTQENRHFINKGFLAGCTCDTIVAPVRTNVIDFDGIRNFKGIDIIVDCELPEDTRGLNFVESTHHTATRIPYWYNNMIREAAINAVNMLNGRENNGTVKAAIG